MKVTQVNKFLLHTLLLSQIVSSFGYAKTPSSSPSVLTDTKTVFKKSSKIKLLAQSEMKAPASQAPASPMPTQTSIAQVNPETKTENAFKLAVGVEYSQKTAVEEKVARENETGFTFLPSYKINDQFALGAKSIMTQEMSGAKDTKLSNTQVSLGITGVKINDSLQSVHAFIGALPTDKDIRKSDRFNGGVGISNGLVYTNPLVSTDFRILLTKNFHEFDKNADGEANVEYRLSNSLEIKLFATEKFYLSSLGIYRLGRTYRGKERTAFEIHSDLNYDVNDKLSFNLGVSNDGNALKSNGVDSNISAYNDNTSSWRAGLTLSF